MFYKTQLIIDVYLDDKCFQNNVVLIFNHPTIKAIKHGLFKLSSH